MTASYPMYSWPGTAAAEARLWGAIRAQLPDAPDRLITPARLWDHWLSPEMVLSQTCGMPLRTRLRDRVTLIATPDYQLPGCPPGHYASVFLMAETQTDPGPEAWHQLRFAVNDFHSQSGWAAPQNHMISKGYQPFERILTTGAHLRSAAAVVDGHADITCLDAQSWRLIQRYDPKPLRVVGHTEPTPGLPLITAITRDPAPLRRALDTAIREMSEPDRAVLNLHRLVDIPLERYVAVPNPPLPPAGSALSA